MGTQKIPQHPAPKWYLDLPVQDEKRREPTDICPYCGHTRAMHPPKPIADTQQTCTAKARALMGDPRPCDCSNSQLGTVYRKASSLSVKG